MFIKCPESKNFGHFYVLREFMGDIYEKIGALLSKKIEEENKNEINTNIENQNPAIRVSPDLFREKTTPTAQILHPGQFIEDIPIKIAEQD